MRALLLIVAVLGLSSVPLALAESALPPPAAVMAVRDVQGGLALTWAPVSGASSYVILAGPSEEELEVVAETGRNAWYSLMPSFMQASVVGVAPVDESGVVGGVRVVPGGYGDCVATSTSLQVSLSLGNCYRLIP